MASRIIANLLVAGGAALFRAATQAYRQALVNASKQGMTAEGVASAARASKQLSTQEAYQIMGLESGATWDEVMKRYHHLFTANEKAGSFYLQSKIYRAKERIEQEFKEEGKETPDIPFPEEGKTKE